MTREGAKPCPFCGNTQIYLGQASAMSYHARCVDCGARTKPVELPGRWPEDILGPIPEAVGEEGDDGKPTYRGKLEKYLLDICANAWNRRTIAEETDEV